MFKVTLVVYLEEVKVESAKNTIDFVTIASTGNATDFGDLMMKEILIIHKLFVGYLQVETDPSYLNNILICNYGNNRKCIRFW